MYLVLGLVEFIDRSEVVLKREFVHSQMVMLKLHMCLLGCFWFY